MKPQLNEINNLDTTLTNVNYVSKPVEMDKPGFIKKHQFEKLAQDFLEVKKLILERQKALEEDE